MKPEAKDINKKTAAMFSGTLIAICTVLLLFRKKILGSGLAVDGEPAMSMTPLGFDMALIILLLISGIILWRTSKDKKKGKIAWKTT